MLLLTTINSSISEPKKKLCSAVGSQLPKQLPDQTTEDNEPVKQVLPLHNDKETLPNSPIHVYESGNGEAKDRGYSYLGDEDQVNSQLHDQPAAIIDVSRLCPTPAASQSSDPSTRVSCDSSPKTHRGRVQAQENSLSNPSTQNPTEEDLVLLLMRRHRTRNQVNFRLQRDLHRLQAENLELKKRRIDRDIELEDAKNRWHAALRESHIREADIRTFKEKYGKVKIWACRVQEEYSILRAEGNRLSQEILSLKDEVSGRVTEREDVLQKFETTSETMQKLRKIIPDLHEASVKLETTQHSLAQAQKEVQELELANKSHVLHIEKLEKSQHSARSQLDEQHERIYKELFNISGLLQRHDTTFFVETISQIAESIRSFQQSSSTKEESATQCSSILNAIEESHRVLDAAVDKLGKIQAKNHTTQDSSLQKLVASAGKLRSDLDYVQKLELANQDLSSKVKEANEVRRTIEREKDAVHRFANGLHDTHKQLMREKVPSTDALVELEKVKNSNGELRLMLSQRGSEAKRFEKELEEAKGKCETLESQLLGMRLKHEQEIDKIKADHEVELARKVKQSQEELDTIHAQLVEARSSFNSQEEDRQRILNDNIKLREDITDLSHKLGETHQQTCARIDFLDELQKKKNMLDEELYEAHETLKAHKEKISGLEIKYEEMTQLRAEKKRLAERSVEQEWEITRLEQQLEAAEARTRALQDQVSESLELQTELASKGALIEQLETDLRHACEKAVDTLDLQRNTRAAEARASEVQKKLDTAEVLVQQVPSLLEAIQKHEANARHALEDLETCHNRSASTEAELQERNQCIKDLQDENKRLNSSLGDLDSIREHRRVQAEQIDALKTKLRMIEEERKPLANLLQLLTVEEKSLLTKDVVLAMKATIQRLQNQELGMPREDSISSAKEEARSLRTRIADRASGRAADDIIVPDSQSQREATEYQHGSDISELSDPPDDYDKMANGDTGSGSGDEPSASVSFDSLPRPKLIAKFNGGEGRPGTSNDEMLLRSSDIGSQSPHRPSQANSQQISPMRTRQGSQIRHETSVPPSTADGGRCVRFSTPVSNPKENHAPNSAAKRRQTYEVLGSVAKRRSLNVKPSEMGSARSVTTLPASQAKNIEDVYDLPSRAPKNPDRLSASVATPGKSKKKATNSTKKSSKSAKMEAQFSLPSIGDK